MDEYGARIERGRIVDATGEGMRIASLSRPGIITPPLHIIGNPSPTAVEGDFVYFFLFEDGTGGIIGKAHGEVWVDG